MLNFNAFIWLLFSVFFAMEGLMRKLINKYIFAVLIIINYFINIDWNLIRFVTVIAIIIHLE